MNIERGGHCTLEKIKMRALYVLRKEILKDVGTICPKQEILKDAGGTPKKEILERCGYCMPKERNTKRWEHYTPKKEILKDVGTVCPKRGNTKRLRHCMMSVQKHSLHTRVLVYFRSLL